MNRRLAKRLATVDLSVAARDMADSYRNWSGEDTEGRMSATDRQRMADAFDALATELYGRYHPTGRKPKTAPVDPDQVDLFDELYRSMPHGEDDCPTCGGRWYYASTASTQCPCACHVVAQKLEAFG